MFLPLKIRATEEVTMYYYGQEVRLRPPEHKDVSLFVQWLSNPELRNYVMMRYISEGLEERWFEGLLTRSSGVAPTQLYFVIETLNDKNAIGVVSLENINWRDREAEVGILIGESVYWGQGYGTDAMIAILKVGFDWYNLHRIFLRVIDGNVRALRSYEKCGFVLEGRLRQSIFVDGGYKDMLMMGVLADEFDSSTDE